MKSYSTKLCVLLAFFLTFVPVVFADTVTLGSYGSANSNPGFDNSAMTFLGYSHYTVAGGVLDAPAGVTKPGLPGTRDLNFADTWEQAIGDSSWVSFKATGPGGPSTPRNGYYYYSSTFSATPGLYIGTISALADDTAEIWLDGQLLVSFANIGNDSHCAIGGDGPTCGFYGSDSAIWTVPVDMTLGASNWLTIVDAQTGRGPAGVDFDGSLHTVTNGSLATPEPDSQISFELGVTLLAVVLFRKSSRSVRALKFANI